MNEQEREIELQWLLLVLKHVSAQLQTATDTCNDSQTGLKHSLEEYWENVGRNSADSAQYIETIDRQRGIAAITENRRRQLIRMADSPYFGRIDFTEEESTELEQIYIGITTLSDETNGRLLVYDWRTPVASMYYDFERGPAWYLCPAGKVSGNISRKRQYKILNGKLIFAFDSDLRIDDEILQDVLSKSVDEQMHTIVTSIQREQNQIIRNEGYRALFVQGPAGSGKTSIALHRIAYLLYRDRDTITSQNVLILSPNNLFSEYIASVLPEIGEENVLRMTFQDCAFNSDMTDAEGRSDHLEYLFSQQDSSLGIRASGISYKTSAAFMQVLKRYVDCLDRDYVAAHPEIVLADQVLFSQEDWQSYYQDSYSFLPPARRLSKIHELIQRRMQPLVRAMRQEKIDEITATGEEINGKTIRALARMAIKRALEPLYRRIESLTTIDSLQTYQRLFSDQALFQRLTQGLAIPSEWPEIRQQSLRCLRNKYIPHEDLFPYIFLKGMLEGFAVKREIKHLVIDEAQDYTALQYAIMVQLFPHCSWTVLGDPAQAIHPYMQAADFETAAAIISIENPVFFQLKRSYRSTRQIQAFCQAILASEPTESIQRDGPLPQIMRLDPHLDKKATVQIIHSLQDQNQQFIAIIAKTVSDCQKIAEALHEHVKVSLITSEHDDFTRGVVIIPAYLAKGLEFDSVLIVNADKFSYGQETDRHMLYTICTRALHRLIICFNGVLTPLISVVNPHLYEMIP